jgi:hypothetical protein
VAWLAAVSMVRRSVPSGTHGKDQAKGVKRLAPVLATRSCEHSVGPHVW